MAEGADIAIEEARKLVSNRLLWPLVRDFLWDFAPSIYGSWFGSLEVWKFGSLEGVSSKPRNLETSKPLNFQTSKLQNLQTSPRVKRHVLSSLGVEPCFHTFPKEDGSRLLLLDGATLESIAKWLGALACAGALRRVTDGATVRDLKAALSGVYPEVFGYTMYFGRDLEELGGLVVRWLGGEGTDVKLNADFVVGVGCSLLHATVAHLPEPLRLRLRLKLANRPATKQPNYQTVKPPNLQLLLKLRYPEAYKLCCS